MQNNPEFNTQCKQCGTVFNTLDYTFCPCCFKLQCDVCRHIWISTRYNAKQTKGRLKVYRQCPECGTQNPSLIFDKESCDKARATFLGSNPPWNDIT